MQKRPAPRRIGTRAVTTETIAPGAVTSETIAPGAVPTDPAVIDAIEAAQDAADFAQLTADGKNKIYRQTTQPPVPPPPGVTYTDGDLWFDTDDGNKFYRYTGSVWSGFTLGDNALASINATKITAGSLDAGVIVTSNLDAGQITAGFISSARINSASISAADINANRITAGTISGITVQASDGAQGVRITTSGYIQGLGGDGVRVANSDGSTGPTQLFKDLVLTDRVNTAQVNLGDGTSFVQLRNSFINIGRYTDDTGAPLNIYRRSWTGDSNDANGDSRSNYAALIAFYKESAGSATSAIRWRSYDSGTIPAGGPTQVVLDNFQTNVWSDARLKQEISTSESALDIVKNLNPKSFSWKTDATDTAYYGMFAQEMHKVLPNLVKVGSTGDSAPIDDATGEYVPEDVWSVDYVSLVPYLIGAIKELSAKIAELESR